MLISKLLLIGSNRDKTYSHTKTRLLLHSINFDELNLEDFYSAKNMVLDLERKIIALSKEKQIYFEKYTFVYHRIMLDENLFGELTSNMYHQYQILIILLNNLKPLGIRVINYPSFADTNSSKIFQLIQTQGVFKVPKSLCTTSFKIAGNFISNNPKSIFKSCSSIRSIVKTYKNENLRNLKNTPCLFQELISGFDVRVHVIDGYFFCEKIISSEVDYRYSSNNTHDKIELPGNIKNQLLIYMMDHNLEFIGADFKVSNKSWYLLEINTMPGYSGYDERTNYEISDKLISIFNQTFA